MLEQYHYDHLTWPEIDAAALRKVIVLPVGSTEQHGHHLPIDVDNFLATNMGLLAAQRAPDRILLALTIFVTMAGAAIVLPEGLPPA